MVQLHWLPFISLCARILPTSDALQMLFLLEATSVYLTVYLAYAYSFFRPQFKCPALRKSFLSHSCKLDPVKVVEKYILCSTSSLWHRAPKILVVSK